MIHTVKMILITQKYLSTEITTRTVGQNQYKYTQYPSDKVVSPPSSTKKDLNLKLYLSLRFTRTLPFLVLIASLNIPVFKWFKKIQNRC
jgi:hypothetical protein